MVRERILAWNKYRKDPNKNVPANIVYFRDGVSEGQYDAVLEQEVAKIKEAWRDLRKTFKPKAGFSKNPKTLKITAIIGGKRHHTRFYPVDQSKETADERGGWNCLPGTLVDQAVTSPYYRDFYLQSHRGVKGTARSTHYFVIKDEQNPDLKPLDLPLKVSNLPN